MLGLSRNLRVAFRLLLRTPGPTIAMLTSLAVGVGTCTTVFSWINATLVEPFPAVARSGEYVVLASRTPSGGLEPLSYAGDGDLRDAAPVFDNLVAVGVTLNALNFGTGIEGQHTERVFANFVSGNYFHVAAVIGRLIAGLLVGVSPVDPLVFGGVILLIVAAVLGASFVPAAKASRLDVMQVLRS